MRITDAHPTVFAGSFMSASHSSLCVLYVGDPAAARATLDGHVPAALPVVWVRVRYNAAELSAMRAQAIAIWHEVGIEHINAVTVDQQANRIAVSMPVARPEVVALLRARLGDALRIDVEPADEPAAAPGG